MRVPQTIPTTLEEGIDALVAELDASEIEHIRARADEGEQHHMFLGMSIRNAWVHPKGSPLAAHFRVVYELGCSDDISTMILKGLWAKVRGDAYDARKDAARYREFWRRQGVDPVTLMVSPRRLWSRFRALMGGA